MPARGWLREWLFRARLSFWAICIRLGATARICYRLLLKTQVCFGIAVSSLLRAAIPSARSSFDARARWRGTKLELGALRGVCGKPLRARSTALENARSGTV